MKRGLIVYNSADQEKNSWFIDHALKLLNDENVSLSYLDEDYLLDHIRRHEVDFVIYRARNSELVKALEEKGIKVFNNYLTNKTANDKYLAYQFFKENKLPCVETFLDKGKLKFPFIMKSLTGHGGREVFLVNKDEAIRNVLRKFPRHSFLYQKFLTTEGDVRIYLLNNEIIGAVKRVSESDYRHNYSLGGEVTPFEPSEEMKEGAIKISKLLGADYIGVDLLLLKDGYLFNEIEDPVGSRMLLKASNIDSVTLFLESVKEKLLKE